MSDAPEASVLLAAVRDVWTEARSTFTSPSARAASNASRVRLGFLASVTRRGNVRHGHAACRRTLLHRPGVRYSSDVPFFGTSRPVVASLTQRFPCRRSRRVPSISRICGATTWTHRPVDKNSNEATAVVVARA